MQDELAVPDSQATLEIAPPLKMSELVRDFDWTKTPLGASVAWPDSLKAAVQILLTSGFPMWMAWGPELTVLYNDGYARTTLGKKHPWALGRPVTEVWSEIWNEIGPRIHRVLETGEASWDETLPLILERSGYREETYHTFSYSPLVGPDGTNAGLLCVVIEDTLRVLGERQLASLGTLAATLVDANTEEEVFRAIGSGLANQKDIPFALTYLFAQDEEGMRLFASSGIDPDHPAACSQIQTTQRDCPWPIDKVLREGRAVTIDDLAMRFGTLPYGSWDKPPTIARLIPIARKGLDTPAGVFIAALNPYRQLDASYAGYLDLVVGQIAASIANARAYEEEKKRAEALTELDRAKTAFFSNVSHELRTPLTLILGPIEDAITNATPPSPSTLEMLHRNALRLLKLVNGLLDFARIEAGRMRASFEPTDLSVLTAQLASVFRSAVERAGLRLVVECPPLPEPVYVDRDMWEKVVLNLLSNAIKSTFEGEIKVSLAAHGSDVHLTVADTGTGISESELPRLFERFRRIEGARRRSHEGSGIGLALVKELVEMHGGSIAVESSLNLGTSFTVTLPLGKRHLSQDRIVSQAVSPVVLPGSAVAYVREALGWLPGQERPRAEAAPVAVNDRSENLIPAPSESKPTILLVDDNADMREYVQGLLGGRFDVIPAENGRLALKAMERRKPDLVLTDVMMPELDGFGLLRAVRENPSTCLIPVVMLSARAGDEARIGGIDAGADDYLTKPFTARELLARVEAQLKMARLRKEAQEHQDALTRELQQARQFAWEALEHIPESFGILDRQFRITYLNPAAVKVTSKLGKQLLGECLWDVYPKLKGTVIEAQFQSAMVDRIPVEFEHYFRDAEGEMWFHFQIYPQPGEGVIVYMRNTTETRRTEQALRRSEQLAAAGRLASSIAHEINNPLEAVTNLLFLARLDQSVSANTKDLLEIADKELQRLSHITARSLKFYRQRTAPSLTALEELLDSVLFFHETDIKLRHIHLERRYRSSPQVLCLAGEIQQVFTNLISNALDAVNERARLFVRVHPSHDREGREGVTVIVADSGAGMDRFTLDRVFHPFMTTKGEAGTGLGLWVSKGILDKHHSKIALRSRKGTGTIFRLFLPLDTIAGPTVPESQPV